MDTARWFIAVMMIVWVPPAIAAWYLIHPFAPFWRRMGTVASFCVIYSLLISGAVLLWHFSPFLIGRDLGFQPLLLAFAVPVGAVGTVIAKRRRKHLSERVLVGIPEVSKTDKGRLLTEGIYARTRNPRYLEFVTLSFAYVAFANYSGAWVLFALIFPALHVVVLLEERELRARFGAEYEEYCRRVPRYFPRGLIRL